MSEVPRFEPNWAEEPTSPDGIYYPGDIEKRTPHPEIVPRDVLDIVASTYNLSSFINNENTRFPIFPKLSVELRRMIWRWSLSRQRVVEIFNDSQTGVCSSPCLLPTALHVSQEVRSVALESYELCFATLTPPAQIFFDMEVDVLYLGAGNFNSSTNDSVALFFPQLQPQDLGRIKHIAIDSIIAALWSTEDENDPSYDEPGVLNLGLTNVQTITYIKTVWGRK
jgi:2EXR family